MPSLVGSEMCIRDRLRVPLRNLFHFSVGSHSFFTMADPQNKTSIGPLGEIPHQPHSKNRQRSLRGPRWSQVGLPPRVPPRNLFHFHEGAPCVCPRRATRGDAEGPLGARRGPVYWDSIVKYRTRKRLNLLALPSTGRLSQRFHPIRQTEILKLYIIS